MNKMNRMKAGLILMLAGCALTGLGQTNTPILRGVLQSNLDANGHAITNLYFGSGPTREPCWMDDVTFPATRHQLVAGSGRSIFNMREEGAPNNALYIGDARTVTATAGWNAISLQVASTVEGNNDPRITFHFSDWWAWRLKEHTFHGGASSDKILLEHDDEGNLMLAKTNCTITFRGTNWVWTNTAAAASVPLHVYQDGQTSFGGNLTNGAGGIFLGDESNGRGIYGFGAVGGAWRKHLSWDPVNEDVLVGDAGQAGAILMKKGLSIQGGTVVQKVLSSTATLDFPKTSAQRSSDLTMPVPGAAPDDVVSISVPTAAVLANSCYSAWVSSANTVTVRFNNYSSRAQNPASGTFRAMVTHF